MKFRVFAAAALVFVTAGMAQAKDLQTAIFAGGCFWCVEADMDQVNGVVETISGYTGGTTSNPTYKQVTRGDTGHYEAVKVTYDADIVSYETLVRAFWRSIDPTDAGGQFCDRGDSYRSAIFVDRSQQSTAEATKAEAQAQIGKTIVTPILKASPFYPAEAYHQDYYQSSKKVLTRFGRISKKNAYKQYRNGCGRDDRVKAVWGQAFKAS